jgi:pantetheine-phosphate adenylyltransferase
VTACLTLVIGDVLLKNKKHRELIQPFTERSRHVTQFMKHVKPHEALLVAELTEPAGPSATEPNAACLVATQETASALDSINQIRQSKGLQPLVSYVLGMLPPPKELAQYDSKISSTTLRALDQGK